jgi:hypothetical protein
MMKRRRMLMLVTPGLMLIMTLSAPLLRGTGLAQENAPDTPFVQETRRFYRTGSGNADIRAIAVDGENAVWAGGNDGLLRKPADSERFEAMLPEAENGPVFALAADNSGVMWAGAWNGLYRATEKGAEKTGGIGDPVAALCAYGDGIAAATPGQLHRVTAGGAVQSAALSAAHSVRAILPGREKGVFWLATGMGLYRVAEGETRVYQLNDEILCADVSALARDACGRLLAGGLGGISVFDRGIWKSSITPEDGLPSNRVNALVRESGDRIWIATEDGLARHDGASWSLRHSRRWLPQDTVHAIAFDSKGTAWIATSGGIAAIERRTMTLKEKADYFMEVCMARHVRPPFIVEKCRLPEPGNTEKWEPEDDDNDGGYTAFFLAGEACRYAVTGAADAKENAEKAFELLHFLQEVTETGGFFARTVIPADWDHMHDPNRTWTAREKAVQRIEDPRFKPVEVRWRPTENGKWLWKGDTSSDEVTAHFFGHLFYYELVADDARKARVREVCRKIMDWIIDHGYVFADTDGEHTRWGVWAPEKLNHDPHWRAERGINSAEILSFLKVTYHMTGIEKYQEEYLKLLHEHHYLENVRNAQTFERAWRTHIDTELLGMVWPGLLLLEDDPELLRLYQESLDRWYEGTRNEMNAFGNMIYALCTGRDPERESTLDFLRDTPLDLINWRIDNSQREDLDIVHTPVLEANQINRLLPPSERGVVRWDKNPFDAVKGDGGRTEWAPSFWLTPYWMARYAGVIAAPATSEEK